MHGAVQNCVAQRGVAQRAWHSRVWHGMAQHDMAQHGMTQHGMAQHYSSRLRTSPAAWSTAHRPGRTPAAGRHTACPGTCQKTCQQRQAGGTSAQPAAALPRPLHCPPVSPCPPCPQPRSPHDKGAAAARQHPPLGAHVLLLPCPHHPVLADPLQREEPLPAPHLGTGGRGHWDGTAGCGRTGPGGRGVHLSPARPCQSRRCPARRTGPAALPPHSAQAAAPPAALVPGAAAGSGTPSPCSGDHGPAAPTPAPRGCQAQDTPLLPRDGAGQTPGTSQHQAGPWCCQAGQQGCCSTQSDPEDSVSPSWIPGTPSTGLWLTCCLPLSAAHPCPCPEARDAVPGPGGLVPHPQLQSHHHPCPCPH